MIQLDRKKVGLLLAVAAAGCFAYWIFKPGVMSLKDRIKGKFK